MLSFFPQAFQVQILQIDNKSEEEGSLKFSCLMSHHVIFFFHKPRVYIKKSFK